MKSNLLKSIFISLILVMGVNNAWAVDHTGGYVYFLKPSTWTESKVMMFIGHNSYTSVFEMTKVDNTDNLYRYTMPSWGGATYVAFANDSYVWGTGNWGPSNRTNAKHYTNVYNNYGFNSGSYYVVVPASTSNNASITINYKSSASNLNLTTKAIASDKVHGTVSVSGYYMSNATTASTRSAVSSTASNATASTTLAPGSTATFNATASTGYEFEGWYDAATGGNQLSTKSTYTFKYDISYTGKTVYARFKQKQHTVLFDVHSSGHGSLTAKVGNTSITSGDKVNYGSTIVFTAKSADGYQIEGWYKNSDCTTSLDNGTNNTYTVTITGGTNVYVKFVEIPVNSHNITYTEQGEGWTYGAKPTSAEEGATVTFVVNPTAGYRVSVSSDGPALTGPNANNQYTFTMSTKDVKITVDAKPEQYTVTLNKQSGEGGTSSVTATYLAAMQRITTPTRTGYTFNGYFDAASGGTKYYNADGSSAKNWDKTAATTLYAQWTANTYSITYKDQNNAAFSGTHASGYPTTHTYGTATTLSTANKTGYTFDGWFTTSDCSGTAVTSLGATTYTSDITLYAKWTEIPPTTIYVKTDGNCTDLKWNGTGMETLDCEGIYYTANIPASVSEITLTGSNNFTTTTLTVPTDDNILFDISQNLIYLKPNDNWKQANARFAAYVWNNAGNAWLDMTDTDKDGIYECEIPATYTSVIFCRMNPGTAANNFDNGTKWNQTGDLEIPTDAKNLYTVASGTWDRGGGSWSAHYDNSRWTAYSAPTYTITTESGEGGTIEISPSSSVALNTEVTVTMIPEDGYTFKSGTITMGNQTPVTITKVSSTYTICGPTTITAEFESNIRTVTFDANGHGTTPEKQTINSGEKATEPAPLTEEGYTFGGWYTEKECTTQFDFNTEITENTTLYAKWTEIKHTVTISAGENGSVDPSGERQIGIVGIDVTATPTDATRFRFAKWEVTGGAQIVDATSATTRITATAEGTVTAHFEELQPKTIYLKTVEGTEDGVKWYVRYNSTETLMAPLGCTGEFYTAEVPEQTEFQLIAKDQNGDVIAKETRDGLVIPNDDKNLFNLVAAGASGDKIFFKPNSHWKNHSTHKYFVARFWTGSAVIKDLVDPDGDGIYECEKPAGAIEVYFCLTKAQASASSGKDWPSDDVAHTNNNVKEGFKDGKNLFTLGDDQTVGGENDNGTWSTHADTPVNGEGEWTIFEGATYRITFNHEGATSGTTTPGVAHVDAQHNSAMPTIESLPKNTDWKFAGYYTAADGGTPITNAFGDWLNADGYISNGKWAKEECVELYAHWKEKTPEITNVALGKNVFDVGSVETVTATPTVVVPHSYQGSFTICWKLLDNSGTVMDLFPFTSGDNNSVSFSVDGLTSGTYTVRASIYASACDTGEELSRFDAKITIVSGYKVTVKYLCGDNVIQAPSIAEGHATTPVEITATEIGGYKFVNWELGDGIFSESDLNSKTISYTAIYDGYLTAKYEKRKLIFLDLSTLKTKANWTAPHIYLYKGAKDEQTGGYWNDQTGAGGGTGGNYITHAAMTPVPNTENIWYFDYEQYTNNFNVFVAFTSNNQGNATHFANCEAIYRTEFSSGTPVFVPESDQTAETKNSTAKYYSKGYWVKYMDGTGYWMIIYNAAGDKELVRREFTSETQRMTMTSIVDLEAEHTYQYEIYRNDGYYYKGGDITYTNSSTYRPLNEANKHSIKTTETGDYTFTLDYSKGDLQIKVQYPGEVGDYRILYTDDVREGRYKPSQIISQNNKEPLVSFFVRPNNNPVLKVQKATLVTETEVKWDNNVLYLTPHQSWKSDGARFAAYFYNNSGNTWANMTSIKNGEYYGCAIPEGTWTNVIFCRMNPNIQENRWNRDDDGDNKPVWNQTVNLTITNGNNQFTITDPWNANHDKKATGTWSKHDNDIIDLSTALKEKLGELGLTNIKADTGTVFNIHLSNNSGTPTIEKVALYTGNYYIRVDAVDGKWYDYKTNPDNLMTYSAFSESKENSFGEKFSHYKTKWCSREKGAMNVKFVIANDYSLCISDTLTQDEGNPFGNIDEHGNITNDGKYDANIRFMWNRHTNKVSRAYVAGASGNNTRFLVLKADQTIQNESGQEINNNEVVFTDTQNWLYEHTIKVQPGTLVKLIAYYPDGNKAQYFRGTSANGFEENVSAVQILGGTNKEWYTMRLIYDFKTNRLMGAWVPDQNINDTLAIDADIMVIRQHQEDATYITFANDKSQLSNVKTVYGVMRFNRWTLNNRSTTTHDVLPVQNQKSIYERALYFISFPFDVHLSDVFGFGTYGTHWVISEYNGLRRATNGYFVDNCMNEDCTNWDYIWDPDDFTMKANQGYLLSLDLDLMKHDNTSFWAHDIQQVELFFPSFAHVETIKQTSYTMPALGDEYQCTINFNKANPGETGYNPDNDHRVRDSYWRCIGVPSFADYNNTLTDGTNKITWQPKGSEFPFLYEWNVSDNSLMVRAATNYKFRSTFAYLVQNGNPIYWSAVNTKPSNIVARSQEAKRNYEWRIAISRNGEVEDQTFVRLSDNEQVTTEFDFNQDLSKEFNYGRSDIYTLIGYEKAAANSLPLSEQTTLIPLGLSIEYNGDYTIAMPDGTANIGVTLVDNQTGTRTNLSAGMEYTLTLKKGDYNNRFFIEISPIQQTPTDIEYVENSHDDQARKVLIDNILYIVRDGQIFDARGARVK